MCCSIRRRRGVQLVDALATDDLLLDLTAPLEDDSLASSATGRQRERHAALGEHLVRGVDEIEHLGQSHVRDRLIDDLLRLHRRDADLSAAPSITRYSRRACEAMIAASWTIRRVRTSSVLPCSTSSNAKLSKTSISSGSVVAKVDT